MLRRSFVMAFPIVFAPSGKAADFDSVRARILSLMNEQHVPGVAVAVAADGKIVWEEGFGYADKENQRRATAHTPFSIASATKPMTATALLILSQRGKIDLDRPIGEYLGKAKLTARVGAAQDATVRAVARHVSGLPEHYHFFYADQTRKPPAMGETIRRYGNLVWFPGERFVYSNLGYGLLGHAIARVAGKELPHVLEAEIFHPLGMQNTIFGQDQSKGCAVRYDDNGTKLPAYGFDHEGASAAWSSAHDLVRFGMFHSHTPLPDQKPILTVATMREMKTIPADQGRGYAIAWNVWRHPSGFTVFYHGGNMPGVSSDLTIIPERRIAVAVVTNKSCTLPYLVNDEIIYRALLPAPSSEPAAKPAARATGEEWEAPAVAGRWTGAVDTYAGARPIRLEVSTTREARVTFGNETSPLQEARFGAQSVQGVFIANPGIDDALPDSRLRLYLDKRNDELWGTIFAYEPRGHRVEYGLSQWARLHKA